VQIADAAALLESSLPMVDEIIAEVARRHRVRGDDLAEFRSLAYMKLLEHDYAVLRRFQGTSSIRTYLSVVLHRVLLDQRNREWGRWRPSAAAHRIGPVAVRLERLVTRDGLTADEAVKALGSQDLSACTNLVETLQARGPVRCGRATLGEEAIPENADPSAGPDETAENLERQTQVENLSRRVQEALESLDSEDHLIVTLRFRDGLSMAEVAKILRLESKPLYRRIERILARLKEVLTSDVSFAQLAQELAGDTWFDHASGELGWWRSSNELSGSGSVHRHGSSGRKLSRRGTARRVHRRVAGQPESTFAAASM
jgi:RNA polymerase sigma factor for flagellar operon FliA